MQDREIPGTGRAGAFRGKVRSDVVDGDLLFSIIQQFSKNLRMESLQCCPY